MKKATAWKARYNRDDGVWEVYRRVPAYGFHPPNVRRSGLVEVDGTYEGYGAKGNAQDRARKLKGLAS